MKSLSFVRDVVVACGVLQSLVHCATAAPEVDLPISATTADVESDISAVYYSSRPLLLGNDGSAATGGFHAWSLDSNASILPEVSAKTGGRSKLVAAVYDVGKKDLIVTIAMPDSVLRVFDAEGKGAQVAEKKAIGDWSALCPWKSAESGNQYFYLFGKKQAVQYLVRKKEKKVEVVEIQIFDLPVEASSCAVSSASGLVYFSGDDSKDVYAFRTAESTVAPTVSVIGEANDDVTGLATYVGKKSDYLLVAQTDIVGVYSTKFALLGSMKITGVEDAEIQGLSIYQGKTKKYPAGVLAFAIEHDEGKGFAISSLQSAFKSLKLDTNTNYDPSSKSDDKETICDNCNDNGFCVKSARRSSSSSCSCFAGFTGKSCKSVTCTDNCSGHGKCIGANECRCDAGWGGLHCSFLLVAPKLETEANGGDGDDPAIWISPISSDQSRIVTTTKSEAGAGLAVFNLDGKILQTLPAGEPNNIDMIYGFALGNNRTIDLAYAACRKENTLCLFEMSANGTLSNIAGGEQPVVADYDVYGSCAYRSPKTGVQYLFVNNKKAEYLQYSLTSSPNGTLSTTLIRQFIAGSGGQVEGCVTDEENGFLFVGEEPEGLWRYDAEPDNASPEGVKIASVATYPNHKAGDLYSDVEGVTLVPGKTASEGFLMVSCQGVSGYNVYERAPPHAFVQTFTITNSADGSVDHVTNTDGIAVVGNRLNALFPAGLVVVHDDANELAGGGTSEEASFKLVSLADVLKGKLLDKVDKEWDPRA
ncbi:hypothetical protein V500_09083 [Pseudogymnoascus sp. VKM F-4518 (FW-2643)]|nr:hypothetical protein V500_09083 [Pseudogymnoascus sp. VKM F-4518 (FW-2643)]